MVVNILIIRYSECHDYYYSIVQIQMTFQTNRLLLTENGMAGDMSSSTFRLKTWNTDLSDQSANTRRFQRSQLRKNDQSTSNPSLTQRPPTNVQVINLYPDKQNSHKLNEPSKSKKSKSLLQQVNFDSSIISKSKFIPQTTRDLRYKDAYKMGQVGGAQDNKKQDPSCAARSRIQSDNYQSFPFKMISTQNTSPYFKAQHSNTKQANLSTRQIQNKDLEKRKIPVKIIGTHVDLNDNNQYQNQYAKNHLVKGQITNFSTQSSIIQQKHVRKTTIPTQTQAKRYVNYAINTQLPKTITRNTQTDESSKMLDKFIDSLKSKIQILESENKQLKNLISSGLKEKDHLLNVIKQCEKNLQKKQSILQQSASCKNLININQVKQQQNYRQISLQSTIDHLKKQIQILKSGLSIKKMEEIIDNIKQENRILTNQLQGVSIRCRMYEQQSCENSIIQQQKRKLKLQIKYLKASIMDHKDQIDRLKCENKKLRGKVQTNNQNFLGGSRAYTAWGSQTDSLNLSISMVRE